MDCDEFKYFWIKWDYEMGMLSLGEGKDPTSGEIGYAVMSDFRKLQIRYFSFLTQ